MTRLLYSVLVYFVLTACGEKDKTQTSKTPGEVAEVQNTPTTQVPALSLMMRDGTKTTLSKLSGNIALILFQPDCDHCQREAKDIRRNLDGFKDFQLYLISSAPMEEVIQFAREYDLEGKEQVHLGTTTVQEILRNFGPIDAPSIYLYSKDGQLIQSFNGETAVEVVLKYI